MAASMEKFSVLLRGLKIMENIALYLFLILCTLFSICNADSSITCGVKDSYFDVKNLTVPQYWEFPLKNTNCLDNGKGNLASCTFYMAFCKQLPESLGSHCAGNSVCQKSGNKTYSVGSYTFNAFEGEKTSFAANFTNGDKYEYNNKSCNLSILFNFECDFGSDWIPAEKGQPTTVSSAHSSSITFHYETCSYIVNFKYSGACIKVQPQPTPKPEIDGSLSTGSILVIIFVFAVGAYLFLGITWNFCQGYTGEDLLPNKKFWASFWEHVKEGCVYFWGLVTCDKSEELDPNYEKI